jgi:hypothetical protein
MIKLSDIEISKSIKTGYLNRKQNWLNFIDRIIIALIFIGLTISVSLFFLEIDPNTESNNQSAYFYCTFNFKTRLEKIHKKISA